MTTLSPRVCTCDNCHATAHPAKHRRLPSGWSQVTTLSRYGGLMPTAMVCSLPCAVEAMMGATAKTRGDGNHVHAREVLASVLSDVDQAIRAEQVARLGEDFDVPPDATTESPDATGTAVTCVACGRRKAPRGRSAPHGAYCTSECPGHACRPLPGDLWPGETRGEFGYPCRTAGELRGQGPVYEGPRS